MKNWQIIMWLVLFFPVGLYLMFKHSSWSRPIKYGLTGMYALTAVFGGLELWLLLFFFTSFFIVIAGIISLIRKQDKRQSIGILALGIILFSSSYQYIDAQEVEQARIEQQEQEEQAEKERLAEEKKQQEMARKEEQKQIKEEKKLKEQIIEAIEKVEEEPTKSNYNKAIDLLNKLNDKDERLVERLDTIKSAVDEYEEELKLAKEAVEKAESDLNRETYNEAYKLVVTLSIPNNRLDRQLEELDQEIIKIEEEEKLAKEKEEEKKRIAVEKAEEERVAAEKAAQEKEQQQANAEAKTQSSNDSSQSGTSQTSVPAASTPAPGEYVDAHGEGLIKGSSSGIYHVPGSTYYDRTTKPVRMFKTVSEAEAAGYRAPKR